MAETGTSTSPFDAFTGTRHWKIWAIAAAIVMIASGGTWVAGQYQIGRLDSLLNRYDQPITDYAHTFIKARRNSLEAELLDGCKQAQIGTWLQTTDALSFEDPATGSRVIVTLDPGRAHVDLNGRELSSCVSDEIENRQFDIGSMTNTWALVMFIISLGMAAWSWFGWDTWRRRAKHAPVSVEAVAKTDAEAPVNSEPPRQADL